MTFISDCILTAFLTILFFIVSLMRSVVLLVLCFLSYFVFFFNGKIVVFCFNLHFVIGPYCLVLVTWVTSVLVQSISGAGHSGGHSLVRALRSLWY